MISSTRFQELTRAIVDNNLVIHNYGKREDAQYFGNFSIPYQKVLQAGISSNIDFDLKHAHSATSQFFSITLYRINEHKDTVSYPTLFKVTLRNLLLFEYQINPFLPDKLRWEFSGEEQFIAEMTKAFNLLVQYGIPWLEDPDSERHW
jgi:hypothetical protein